MVHRQCDLGADAWFCKPMTRSVLFFAVCTRTLIVWILVVLHPLGPHAEGGVLGVTRTVQGKTSTARQGTYYLPNKYDVGPLPLMVVFHGTGGKGSLMVRRLQALADREGFIVLAPDSVSVSGVWSVASQAEGVTEDYRHVMECVREILQAPGVRVDAGRVLAAGFSVGASVAP